MNELTINEIHAGTLIIIKKIDEICEKLNIRYVLMYGTLLGAVREKGFIPWDDDFDIAMLRPDYDKFVQYCMNNKLDNFKLFHREISPNYYYNISRFCDINYILKDGYFDNAEMGMFIDIYPLDGIGNSKDEFKNKYGKQHKRLFRFVYNAILPHYKQGQGNRIHNILHFFMFYLSHIIGKKRLLNKLESYANLFNYEESEYVGNVVWIDGVIPIKKEDVLNSMLIDFEDLRLRVPANYEDILIEKYGDYMKRPPKDKQVPSHSYSLYRK